MKKNFFKRGILSGALLTVALAGGLILGGEKDADAATIKCYTISSGNTTVYSNTGLNSRYGTIYSSDELIVQSVTDRYCKVSYPVSWGRKTGYISTGTILTKTGGSDYKARARITTYKRPGGASYGYIDTNDTVRVLGTSGNYTQVKYPVAGGYKYAFITTGNANSYVLPQAPAPVQNQDQTTGPITDEQAKALLFVPRYYADSYSDLKAAFGYNEAQLYNHYLRHGISEGRSASPIFDPVFYLNNNGDLKRAFGNDYTQAYNHWIRHGCSEGRSSSKYYNGYYYRSRYSDLQKAFFYGTSAAESYCKLANHYLTFGIREKRYANSNGYLPNWNTGTASQTPAASTWSLSGSLLTVNGVSMNEYQVGKKYTTSRYANVNGRLVDMQGWQCCGYARYVLSKLYGCHDLNAQRKFKDVSGYISSKNLTAAKMKSVVQAAGVGAHIRTNQNSRGYEHSLVIIGMTEDGFTITDANSDGNYTVRVKTFTWSEYISAYGNRGLMYVKKYVG